MSTCQNCREKIPEGADFCGNCAKTNSTATPAPATQIQNSPSPNASSSDELSLRLEKALRRNELLSYAAAGLAVAILAVILIIAFL